MSSRVTLKQIAEELGFSIMTVSRALNNKENVTEKTRVKVLNTAQKLGYRPNYIAKSLVLNKTFTIGVVVPEITHSFFPEVIRGIEEIAYENDYHLILTHSAEDDKRERDAIATLESKRVDGILISTAQTVENFNFYKKVMQNNLPFVFFDRYVNGTGASNVSVNDVESSRKITNHLIEEHGYAKIAHLSGPVKVNIGKKRLEGFRKAMADHGLEVNEKFIVEAGFHERGGADAMRKLLEMPKRERPEAVVAVNDPAAYGAMQTILDYGLKIPDDIALTGFSDDIRSPLMPSPLTTIRQPAYEVGMKASQVLMEHISDENRKAEDIIVDTELVIRDSCGCRVKGNRII